MDYTRYETLLVEIKDRVATVTMNLPDQLNAMSERLHVEMGTIFSELDADPSVGIIVLTGAGAAFSAGGDLDWVHEQAFGKPCFQENFRHSRRIVTGILECMKPIVARVNGDAIGVGATLALLCDIIVAVDSANIGDPHVKVGLVAGDGGAVIWPELIGYARAKEYLLTGATLKAPEAERIGLINYSVPAEQLDDRVGKLVGRLQSVSQPAMRYTKSAINIALRQKVVAVLDASLAFEGLSLLERDDVQEGVTAFSERRRPKFTTP